VLVLDNVIGIEEVSNLSGNGLSLSQNYPNPMQGNTTICLRLAERVIILLTVSDVMGREVVRQEFQLGQGSHSFNFYPGRESIYLLTVKAHDQIRSLKMFNDLSTANASGYCQLEYKGSQRTGTVEKKSGNALNNFVLNLGDQLKFTATTNSGERVITSSPTGDQAYYFHYTGAPCPGTPTVSDFDGNVYNTVKMGDQCWMKEDLRTTTYRNGTSIPNITSASTWSFFTTGAYVWYANDNSWKDEYGALYNWYAAIDLNGLCPTGWHVPTHIEWTALTNYIGGTSSPHGNELTSCRQVNSPLGGACYTSEHPRWEDDGWSNTHGTDDYGFSGLPGGFRGSNGAFNDIGILGQWWTSTETSTFEAWIRSLGKNFGHVGVFGQGKNSGFSVRCLRD
jgi:uncharacterized protein (TIGR02145 family)